MVRLTAITNDPRAYAWGRPGGISALLGRPATSAPEAELWFGAHPASPSRSIHADAPWSTLLEWEGASGTRLPFLMKVLSAATPLSLQAHPDDAQARAGFVREDAAGIPRTHPQRSYKDPHAKPELVVALRDGFEALCGFRDVGAVIMNLDQLAAWGCGPEAGGLRALLTGDQPYRAALAWLLSRDPEPKALANDLTRICVESPARLPGLARIARFYPGDPGLAVAMLLNHVVLDAGEALWLPAGNVHAYLQGDGLELMGPSDNVLRGGLTPKHIDVAELQRVVRFDAAPASRLLPERLARSLVTYAPSQVGSGRDVDFQLLCATGTCELPLGSPAIALCTSGRFRLTSAQGTLEVSIGEAVMIDGMGALTAEGAGQLFVATGGSLGSAATAAADDVRRRRDHEQR